MELEPWAFLKSPTSSAYKSLFHLRLEKWRRCSGAASEGSLSSSAVEVAVAEVNPILRGRGDKKTKKGKIFKGSFGNSRPRKEKMIERVKDEVEGPGSTQWPVASPIQTHLIPTA